jgi:hypothetical protein
MSKKHEWLILGTLLSGGILALGLTSMGSRADDDEHEKQEHGGKSGAQEMWQQARLDVAPTTDPKYLQECGSCHFAYPPGLLPARSWDKMMSNLAEHFGENAELPADTLQYLTAYLRQNAADNAPYRRSMGIMRSLQPEDAPLRISETRYFKGEHDELPKRLVQDNPQVKSFSRCDACHSRAGEGSYNEHEINIAGHGRWDD